MYVVSEQDAQFGDVIAAAVRAAGGVGLARSVGSADTDAVGTAWQAVSGLFQIVIPDELGGLGLGFESALLPLMALGADLVPGPFAETFQALVWVLSAPDAQVRRHWADKFQQVAPVIAAPFVAPASRLTVTRAAAGADLVVSGMVEFVPYVDGAEYLALSGAYLAPGPIDPVQALVVPLHAEGVTVTMSATMDATRPVGTVVLDAVTVSAPTQVIELDDPCERDDGDGTDVLLGATAAMQLGALARVVEMAARHARNRVQFGQPIGRYQGIKHRIANMKLTFEGARALVYQAGSEISEGQLGSPIIPTASAYVTDALVDAASANIQVHGAMGYTAEFDAQLHLKRAHAWRLVGGGPDRSRELALARRGWSTAATPEITDGATR